MIDLFRAHQAIFVGTTLVKHFRKCKMTERIFVNSLESRKDSSIFSRRRY